MAVALAVAVLAVFASSKVQIISVPFRIMNVLC
jgi:hypothetical protein